MTEPQSYVVPLCRDFYELRSDDNIDQTLHLWVRILTINLSM